MKKILFVCAAMCAAVAFTSCSSSKESAYRKAYEKAKAQEQQVVNQQPAQQAVQQTPVVTPLVEAPAQQAQVQQAPAPSYNVDSEPVRTETVSVVSGTGLKAFSVVIGSFGVKANADNLQAKMKAAGYDAQVAYNAERNMYRVIASTFDSKVTAVESRNTLRSTYPDAWLLMQK
jgi:cell division protein FtsN